VTLLEVKTLLRHPKASLRRFLRDKPRKLKVIALGGLFPETFTSFKQTVEVGLTVLMERVYYHIIDGVPQIPFRPTTETFKELLSPFRRAFSKCKYTIPAWSYEQYVDSYHGRRRACAQRAVERILTGGVGAAVKGWARIRAFVKHEKLPVTPHKRMVPRAIQPRRPEYNALLGRFIRPAEPHIFKILQKISGSDTPVVGKGMDTITLGGIVAQKWGKFKRPVGIGFDQSRFDQHISAAALRFEHECYTSMFAYSHELASLLRLQLETHGTLLCDDGSIKYSTDGGRCSGDMNTSLGNSLLQFAMIFSYAKTANCSRYEVLVNGDDSFIITEAEHVEAWKGFGAFCERLGFKLTVESPVDVLERLSFCKMQPVFVPELGYIMVRHAPSCFSKDLHTTMSMPSKRHHMQYLAGIGIAGTSLCPGVPICQAFYEALSKLDTPMKREDICGAGWLQWVRSRTPHHLPIAPETRVSFWKAFDILPDLQEAYERECERLVAKEIIWRQ